MRLLSNYCCSWVNRTAAVEVISGVNTDIKVPQSLWERPLVHVFACGVPALRWCCHITGDHHPTLHKVTFL